jgi:type II secretory pathway component PulF
MVVLSEDIMWLLIPACIVFLILLLLFRLKGHIRRTVKNEIYAHFPTIKKTIEEFSQKVDYFKLEIDELERKIKELENRTVR